jgi:hypothetical protein
VQLDPRELGFGLGPLDIRQVSARRQPDASGAIRGVRVVDAYPSLSQSEQWLQDGLLEHDPISLDAVIP